MIEQAVQSAPAAQPATAQHVVAESKPSTAVREDKSGAGGEVSE